MFQNILVIVDPFEDASAVLSWAEALKDRLPCTLHIAGILEQPPPLIASMLPWTEKAFLNEALAAFKQNVVRVGEQSKLFDPEHCHAVAGRFREAARELISELGIDLLLIDRSFRNLEHQDEFSHVARDILRHCSASVLLTHGVFHSGSVAAAVDIGESEEKPRADLNDYILKMSGFFAKSLDVDWHVIRAWSIPYEFHLSNRATTSEIDQIKAQVKRSVRQQVDAAVSPFVSETMLPEVHLPEGEAATVIDAEVHRLNVVLLIVGSCVRNIVAEWFIGHTSESLAARVDRSILVLKNHAYRDVQRA